MNKSNKLTYVIFFLSLIFILPIISATTIISDGSINSTAITSNGLNLTINFTSQLYGAFIINDNSIYIENLRACNLCKSYSFNLTQVNKTYLGNNLIFIANYTTSYNYNEQTSFIPGTMAISGNLVNMVSNFFGLSPMVGTILGICVLLAGILILIFYVRRMNLKSSNNESDTIYG